MVNDRYVIDHMMIEDKKLVLVIDDLLEWSYNVRADHANALKAKISDYMQFIDSGQVAEHHGDEEYDSIVIRVAAKYSFSRYCLDFLERCRAWILENGNLCELEWTHFPDDDGTAELQDGFSDDYIFDMDKIYPRIRKNWSETPGETVALTATNYDLSNEREETQKYDNIPMFRIYDSYIITLMQDMGSTYMYLTYDHIPEDMSVETIESKAFENLHRDITYRMVESKESGVYGLAAGGDFEAEALCLPGIWEYCSEELKDDLLIAVPTKDMVLFTGAGDKKAIQKMLKQAQEIYEENRKESPFLIFSRDVFHYNKNAKQLEISKKYCV